MSQEPKPPQIDDESRRRQRWDLEIKLITVAVSLGSFLWALNSGLQAYRAAGRAELRQREAELYQRQRELTREYRQEQLQMCLNLANKADNAKAQVYHLTASQLSETLQNTRSRRRWNKAIRDLENEARIIADSLNAEVNRAAMLGDSELSTTLMAFRTQTLLCGSFYAHGLNDNGDIVALLDEGDSSDGRVKANEEFPISRDACVNCLNYLAFKASEHCAELVRAWWTTDTSSLSVRGLLRKYKTHETDSGILSRTPKAALTPPQLYWCEHEGATRVLKPEPPDQANVHVNGDH